MPDSARAFNAFVEALIRDALQHYRKPFKSPYTRKLLGRDRGDSGDGDLQIGRCSQLHRPLFYIQYAARPTKALICILITKKHLLWRGLLGWAFLFLPALLEGISAPAIGLWLASVFLFWAFMLWRPALVLALFFLLTIGTVNVVHIGFFGNLADQIFLATAQRTNWEETREFIGVLPWKWVTVAALWLVAGIFAAVQVWKLAPLLKRPSWPWKVALLGLTIWVVFTAFALAKRYSFEEVTRKLKTIYPMHIVRAWTAQQQLTEQLFYTPKLPSTTAQAPQVDTLVVVIGESASAERWSLLGYQQADTNGALAQMQNLQVVRAMAHGLNTAAALPYLLTGMSAQQSVEDLAPSFLDIAQHAGYKTFVLSNSRYHSSVEDFYGVTFRRAADSFVKVGNGDWRLGWGFDRTS